jgi:gluconate 2-dehydrogenase gamma chain
MSNSKNKISRRLFLKGAGAVTVAGVAVVTSGCEPSEQTPATPAVINDTRPIELKYPGAQGAPASLPDPGRRRVFTMQEARTVEALTARILPGTPDDPGAREAGVVTYIDTLLAVNEGFAEPTYRQPPYAQVYEGAAPPANSQEESYQVVYVPADLIDRYGFQAILTPREVYRIGLEAVDRYATAQFGHDFIELSEEQQDTIIGDMAAGSATGFRQVSAEQFFLVLRRHTAEGMFSDPTYGGNRDLAGWRLIGFPGAQRAWTPQEIQTEGVRREPQDQAGLAPFNPGQDSREGAVLPLSGSDPNTWHDAHQHPAR